MANDPQDYSAAFSEDIDAKADITAANDQGMLSVPGVGYVDTTHPDNPAHVFAHGIDDATDTNPIPADNRLKADTWRTFQALLKYLNHIGPMSYPGMDSVWGGKYFTGVVSSLTFRLASVSGSTLTLKCAGPINEVVDPRSAVTWSGVARESIFATWDGVLSMGCFVMPWCLVRFHNCVIESRVQPMIIRPDFSTLGPTVDNTDTFSILVNQDCSNADLALDDALPITVEILAEYQDPERWLELHDQYHVPFKEVTREYTSADWGGSKVIELLDGSDASCRCAFPYRTIGHIWGTFQFEVSSNDGVTYADVTSQIEDGNFPRFVISGKMRAGVKSELYLGPITGDVRDFTSGINRVRVRYMYPVADFSVEGARHPLEAMCRHSQRDYMNWVGTNSTIVAKDINPDGEHFFCAKHRVITPTAAANYTWDDAQRGCPACGGCAFFENKDINRVDENFIAQITSGQNWVRKQSAPGANTVMDWTFYRINVPGLIWQLSISSLYASNYDAAYHARRVHYSGGFSMVDEDDPHYSISVGDGEDIHIKVISGAIWNLLADAAALGLDWNLNRFPADVFGILARRIPGELMALTQFSEERDGTNDPNYQIYSERLGRKIAMGYRDQFWENTDIAYTARSTEGIEGENRPQRLSAKRKFVSGIIRDQNGRQGSTSVDYITIYPTARTVAGVANVRAVVQIRPEGEFNYGRKRIGGAGINGEIWKWESLGGGLYAVHCAPGPWVSTFIDGGAGERHTEMRIWYGGGNVVQPTPVHFVPDGAVLNNPNSTLLPCAHHKAVAGDSIEFHTVTGLAGKQFKIVQAHPFGGDAFSGGKTNIIRLHSDAVGSFVRLDPFFEDDATPEIELTDLETQFTGSVVGDWHSLGTSYFREVLNGERPYDYPGDPLTDNPEMYFDLKKTFDETQFADIGSIYNGGAGNLYRTVLAIPGHGRTTGQVIYLRNTPNNESNGFHTVEYFSDDVLLSNKTDLSPTGEGATGQWIPIGANTYVQTGSGRLYPSLPMFGWILNRITAVLLGGYNNVRVSFKIDGVAQTPIEQVIDVPKMHLTYSLDRFEVVWHRNRATGALEEMTYAGPSLNSWDLFQGESYLNYKYNAATQDVYFHPLVSGDDIMILYRTNDEVDLDGFGAPGEFQRSFQHVPDTAYLKFMDRLVIEDSNGLLAAAGDLLDQGFKVSGGLAAETVTAVAHSPSGEATWTALAGEHWVLCNASNQLFILDPAFDLFPPELNLYWDGLFYDHACPTSAAFMKVIKAAIGCLDQIGWGIQVTDIGYVAFASLWHYGFASITPGDFSSVAHGSPNVRGLEDDYLVGGLQEQIGSLLRIPGHTRNPANHIAQIDPGEYWFSDYTPPVDGPAFVIGCPTTGQAVLNIRIYEIHMPDFLKRADLEILDAEMGCYLPEDTIIGRREVIIYLRWDPSAHSGQGALVQFSLPYPDEGITDTTESSMPGGFGLIGFDHTIGTDGAWVPLGSFADTDGGDLVAGHWRPIKAVGLINFWKSIKTSRYSKIAIYPSPVPLADPGIAAGLGDDDYAKVGILDQIMNSYHSYEVGSMDDNFAFRTQGISHFLSMDHPILYGGGFVRFKLGDEIGELRIQPGPPFPDMRPV